VASGAVLHTLSFATWFGSVAYTTFVLGITMFKNLPRQTFGKLQAKLFPKYFFLGSVCLVLQVR
jgi:ABC-type spermidine/putrescine transport system permease subunit II